MDTAGASAVTDNELATLAYIGGALVAVAIGITLGWLWTKTLTGDPTRHRHRLYRMLAVIATIAYALDQTMEAASNSSVLHWIGALGWIIIAVALLAIIRTEPTRRRPERQEQ